MDSLFERMAQREAAGALLDRGLSVPLLRVRLPWCERPLQLRVTMRRPRLGGMMRLAREYLSLGVTSRQVERFTREEQMAFIVRHGKRLSRMVALTLCRGRLSGALLTRPVAWWVRHSMEPEYLRAAVLDFVFQLGTDPFATIIRQAERINPMKPRLSHKGKGS